MMELLSAMNQDALGISQSGLALNVHTWCCQATVTSSSEFPDIRYHCDNCGEEVLRPSVREYRAEKFGFRQLCRTPATSLAVSNSGVVAQWISAWTGLEDVEVRIS